MNVRRLFAGLGAPLVGLFALVALTGVLLFVGYDPEPVGESGEGGSRGFLVSLHSWASKGLVFVGALHVVHVGINGRIAGRWRRTYTLGAAAFLFLVIAHFTGETLAWDEAGRRLATVQIQTLSLLGGADRVMLLEGPDERSFLATQVLLHGGLVAAVAAAFAWPHVLTARRIDPTSAPLGRMVRSRRSVAIAATVLALALVAPARAGTRIPWPFWPFEWATTLAASWAAFPAFAALLAGLLLAQPWLARWKGILFASRVPLALALLLSFWGLVTP